jgi:hypothetical protein
MYNDMGNVDHLANTYLPTHPLTLPPTYLLLTILQFAYYLLCRFAMI